MSVTGSLEHYDKSNESFLNITDVSSTVTHHCSNLNASISTVTGNPAVMNTKSNLVKNSSQNVAPIIATATTKNKRIHFNRLWSVWYGVLVTLLEGYLIIQGLHKYLGNFFCHFPKRFF